MELIVKSVDELLYKGCKILKHAPEIKSRLGETVKEEINVSFVLKNPLKRYSLLDSRNCNPFHQLVETLWVLSGQTEVQLFDKFLPQSYKFSDDWAEGCNKFHWRAGYGGRIRKWIGNSANVQTFNISHDDYINHLKVNCIDQWQFVIETLKKDSTSRHAIISIYDPAADSVLKNVKDKPCNNHIQFLIRDNKLIMIVNQRSSDLIWGLSAINIPEFTTMQEITASILNVKLGDYIHRIGSLHIYDRHFSKIDKIIEEYKAVGELIELNNKCKIELKFKSLREFDCLVNKIQPWKIEDTKIDDSHPATKFLITPKSYNPDGVTTCDLNFNKKDCYSAEFIKAVERYLSYKKMGDK